MNNTLAHFHKSVNENGLNLITFSSSKPESKYANRRSPDGRTHSVDINNLKPDTWSEEQQVFIEGTLNGLLKKHIKANDPEEYEVLIDYDDESALIDALEVALDGKFEYKKDGFMGEGLYAV